MGVEIYQDSKIVSNIRKFRKSSGKVGNLYYYWKRFDDKYIKPFLIYDMDEYNSQAKKNLKFNQEFNEEEEFKMVNSLEGLLTMRQNLEISLF